MKTHSPNQLPSGQSHSKFSWIHQLFRLAYPAMFLNLSAMAIGAEMGPQGSVSQYGITWTFDKAYPVGQYCNGDWWVLGPVVLTGPVSNGLNGTMVNPAITPGHMPHGYDSRINQQTYSQNPIYNASLNKGLNMPLSVPINSSVISCISSLTAALNSGTVLDHMACLTVVDSVPPAGSFRPGFFGYGSKAATHNKSQIDYTKLANVPLVSGSNLEANKSRLSRGLFCLGNIYQHKYLIAKYNTPSGWTSYGREMMRGIAQVALELNSNYSTAQKEEMAIGMIQNGLDIYHGIQNGLTFNAAGGNSNGHKLIVAMAGRLLNDNNILATLNPATHPNVFVEDKQHFYVTQLDIDTPRGPWNPPLTPYPQSALGMPEWCGGPRNTANYAWGAAYRNVVSCNTMGAALAARLCGLIPAWSNNAFFDYYDRYYEIEKNNADDGTNNMKIYVKNMWQAYRSSVSVDPSAASPYSPTGLKVVD